MDKFFIGILITPDNQIHEISIKFPEIVDILCCECLTDTTCNYMDYFGYNLFLSWDEQGYDKKLPVNVVANILAKELGPVYGAAILIDYQKDINLCEFDKIIEISSQIPTRKWEPEKMASSSNARTIHYQKIMEVLNIDRLQLWDKLKSYVIKS